MGEDSILLALYKRARRHVRWFLQRLIRGYDDRSLWSLDFALFEWFLPKVRAFRKMSRMGTPYHPTRLDEYGDPGAMTEGEWNSILSEIEYSLEYFVTRERWPCKGDAEYRRVMRGYGLLFKWLPALWD
jgi:hypothetical protein